MTTLCTHTNGSSKLQRPHPAFPAPTPLKKSAAHAENQRMAKGNIIPPILREFLLN